MNSVAKDSTPSIKGSDMAVESARVSNDINCGMLQESDVRGQINAKGMLLYLIVKPTS